MFGTCSTQLIITDFVKPILQSIQTEFTMPALNPIKHGTLFVPAREWDNNAREFDIFNRTEWP